MFVFGLLCVSAQAADPAPREPIDIERFKPALTHDGFVVTEGTDVRWPPKYDPLQLGVAVNGSWNPLVLVDGGEIDTRYVSRRVGLDLFGSVTLVEGFAMGVGLPVFGYQQGDESPNPSGIGDLRVIPKLRLADDRKTLGLALLTELRLPTHSDQEFSGGANFVVFAPKLAMEHRFGSHLRLGTNVGVLLRRGTQFENIKAASELTYSAAGAYYPDGFDGSWAVGVDLHGGTGLTAINREELPLEGQLYALVQPNSKVQFQFGPAFGIVPGYGTPTARLYAGIRWSPSTHDLDGDTIPDGRDDCPEDPETRNGYKDADGCPDDEDTAPGMLRVIVVDPDGNPIDTSKVRVDRQRADPTDEPGVHELEIEGGRYTLGVRAPGYDAQRVEIKVPPGRDMERVVVLQPSKVTVTDDKIEFTGKVHFAFDRADILEESDDLLNDIAAAINDTPSIEKVRIEGHTDSRGSVAYNQRLSDARAGSVMLYLINAGVDPNRLDARGYGETRPISDVHAENRRVEFVIAAGDAGDSGWIPSGGVE